MENGEYWEYRVETFGSVWTGAKTEEIQSILNNWGLEGWEVIAVTMDSNVRKALVFAKRHLDENEKRRRERQNNY